ncbi:ABC transporter ATP-binding protein [Alcaligenaceae bacterium]|nr:ABC transporter ATP-binding protein [Alcaligenaceae bacterium]
MTTRPEANPARGEARRGQPGAAPETPPHRGGNAPAGLPASFANAAAGRAVLLEVRGLTRRFGGNLAVAGIDFNVHAGELLALIGPNGAGKSTTFNMVNGQLAATAGSVRFGGREILGMPSHKVARLGVGRSFQIAATFASLTVLQNVQMALIAHQRRVFSFFGRADRHEPERAMALLEQVGMGHLAQQPCSGLAYGDVKRLELAMSLAGDPRLLLMDEPTAGMAPGERNALVALVKDIVRARNMGVLFTEHSMDVVFDHADRIIVLARGRLIAQGDPEGIRAHPEVRRVYFGSNEGLGHGVAAHGAAGRESDGREGGVHAGI